MTGTITYILARAGFRAMNGQISDERRRLSGAETPAAYVSYDPRMLAGAGWYGYRISFKGGDRQMIERARYMLSERYTIRDSYEYFSDGVYVIGVLLRQRVPHYGIGSGVEPTPEPTWLYFTMPNGGDVTLTKNGTPTAVTLEYSLDNGNTWTEWTETENVRSLTLAAGQTMHVRNTSETSTGFSTSTANYYNFAFTGDTSVGGNTNSLLCKIPSNAVITSYCYSYMFQNCISLNMSDTFTLPSTTLAFACYYGLFSGCTNLTMGNAFALPSTTLSSSCFNRMFRGCLNLTLNDTFTLFATNLTNGCYLGMFIGCAKVNLMRTNMTDISATDCLANWLANVSPTGDFYCPAELTIPTGNSGIPPGWTRHDI